jgi:DNA-binding response OmpR family regulator
MFRITGERGSMCKRGREFMRLLIIEDNRHLVANLFDYFEARGYVLDAAPDGITGFALASLHRYDAIFLDWMLPKMEGPDLLRRLRNELHLDVPVIMLTARDELPDKILGFRAGADDYLTKPFALQELEVRLEAVLARSHGRRTQKILEVHDLRLDLASLDVWRAGQRLALYPVGRKLLEVLMRASPAVVSREQLEYAVWGDDPPDGDMLRSHIYDLRRAIDATFPEKLLQTVPRVGYRLVAPTLSDEMKQ